MGDLLRPPHPSFLLLCGLVLVGCGLALAPFTLWLVRKLAPGRFVFFARWGFLKAVVALALLLATQALLDRFAPMSLPLRPFVVALAGWLLAAPYMFWVAREMHPEGWRALGFHGAPTGLALAAGFAALALSLPMILGAGLAWTAALRWGGREALDQPVLVYVLSLSGGELALALVLAIAVLPFFEELLFRGFLQPLFVQNFGDRGGQVALAAFFCLFHPLAVAPPIFALSLVLSGVMLRTQRLGAAWAMHAAHNGLALGVLLLAPETRALLGG